MIRNLTLLFWAFTSPLFAQEPLERILASASETLTYQLSQNKNLEYDAIRKEATRHLGKTPQTQMKAPMSFQEHLLGIWRHRSQTKEGFEAIAPLYELGKENPLTRMLRHGHRGHIGNYIFSKPLPLLLLAPDIRQSVTNYPVIFEQFQQLRKDIYGQAQQMLDNNQYDIGILTQIYGPQFENIVGPYRNDGEMIAVIGHLMTAARLPNLGPISTPTPTLDPAFLLAWEELLVATNHAGYKQMILDLMTPIAAESTSFCVGMVAKQAIIRLKEDPKDQNCSFLLDQAIGYFSAHPSPASVIAIADCIAFAKKSHIQFKLPLGDRLTNTKWTELLRAQGQNDHLMPFLREIKSFEQ